MPLNRWWCPALLCFVLAMGACGSITDSEEAGSESNDRTYVDKNWGFQIEIPDADTWGYSAQTSSQERLSNGLPRTELRITHVPAEGADFLPSLRLQANVLDRDDTVESFAQGVEQYHKSRYMGYQAGDKRYYLVAGAEVVEWVFTTVQIRSVGDRFMAAVVKDDKKGYLLLGTGLGSAFPLDSYREMVSSMKFR
jgi:hypothetical protein